MDPSHSVESSASDDPFASVPSVPPPPSSGRQLWWALPLLTLSWLLLAAVIVAGVVRIQRWETAPGTVSAVGPRLSFGESGEKFTRYPARNSVNFVTAYGSQLSALESFIGWVDTDVDVQTKEQRFGTSNATEQRTLGYQAMVGAKQIAEYVAFKRLGFDARLDFGLVVVEQTICTAEPTENTAEPTVNNAEPTVDNAEPTGNTACKLLNPGDVIVSVDGTPTPTIEQLIPVMTNRKVGEVLEVVAYTLDSDPNDTKRTVKIRLIASPDESARAIIGFVPADTRTVKVPFEISINTDTIGGPSAGLAFTLALLDELTPGDLMGNVKVASTGTIAEDETVGAIGALRQKVVAAANRGADVFLIPASQTPDEIAEAKRIAGNDLSIVPVANLSEALEALTKYGGGELPK
jgi:PDZ domain-containing protein